MPSTAPTAPSRLPSLEAPGSRAPTAPRIAVMLTSPMAGALCWLIAYWIWSFLRGTPWGGFETDLFLILVPLWLPPTIVGAIAALLWRILAVRTLRISLLGGSTAFVLVLVLIQPVISICVELAIITQDGWPSILELVGATPRVLRALTTGLRSSTIYLVFAGPLAALAGLLLAACGRWIVRTVERAGALQSTTTDSRRMANGA